MHERHAVAFPFVRLAAPFAVLCFLAGCSEGGSGDDDNDDVSDATSDTTQNEGNNGSHATDAGLTCFEVAECGTCCPSGDPTCSSACYDAGSQTAQNGITTLTNCRNDSCAEVCSGDNEQSCYACEAEHCASQTLDCMMSSAGTQGCRELVACLASCDLLPAQGAGATDSCPSHSGIRCRGACLAATTPEGIEAFFDATQWKPEGNASCTDLVTCLWECVGASSGGSGSDDSCPADLACPDTCVDAASQLAYDALQGFSECVETNCADDCVGSNATDASCDACRNGQCADELAACTSQ